MTTNARTITVTPGRIATVVAVALGVLVAYLLGSARTAGATSTVDASAVRTSGITTLAAATGSGPTGITVVGNGTVSGTPDTLVVSLSVNANAANVSSALGTANGTMAAVQKALRSRGVESKDLQTSNLSVQATYNNKGTIDGYSVSEGLTATLRDIGKAGDDISAAVAAGRNLVRVDGVSLDLKDDGPLLTKARDDAYADAKAKAEQYAHDAGRGLGAVVSISEQVQQAQPQPMYAFGAALPAAVRSVPIAAGSQQVAVQVTVTFGLA